MLPLYGQTNVCADTVPATKRRLLGRASVKLARANGSAGSAILQLNIRKIGHAWNAIRTYDLTDGAGITEKEPGGFWMPPGTDYKISVPDVSDNNTQIQGVLTTLQEDYSP